MNDFGNDDLLLLDDEWVEVTQDELDRVKKDLLKDKGVL